MTHYLALHAGKSPTSLFYVKILVHNYLHVKLHHAEGIVTVYFDQNTFPPYYVRPVTVRDKKISVFRSLRPVSWSLGPGFGPLRLGIGSQRPE